MAQASPLNEDGLPSDPTTVDPTQSLYNQVFGANPTPSPTTPATTPATTASSPTTTPAPATPAPATTTPTTPAAPAAAPSANVTASDLGSAGQTIGGVPVPTAPPVNMAVIPPNTGAGQTFTPTAPTYTPGTITTSDVPQFSYDQIFGAATAPTATQAATDTTVNQMLANPESMSPQVVGQMEAASKDALAEQQLQEDQQAKETGAAEGISDSPWLASQELAAQRDTNANIVAQDRSIETQAAEQNASDVRAAAQIGASYTGQQQQNQQAAVSLASNTALNSAAAMGDRMALQEQVKQAATQLGQSADQILLQYTLGKMTTAAEENGQTLNYDAAMAALQQGGTEFQENLAMQLSQFGATYGLDLAGLEVGANNAGESQYNQTFTA